MLNNILIGECFIFDTTILVFKVFMYSLLLPSTVKSWQISNIHTHGFLSKCKNDLILYIFQ